MKAIEKEIRNLIKESENCELEFKSAKGGFPESFWETFSAFANTNGGVIVLGIKHKDKKYTLDNLTEEQDKITFRNPGCMLVSVDDFYTGNHSLCRNPILQKFFTQLGIGEKAGSGADFIIKGCDDNKWNHPIIEEKVQPDRVIMTFYIKETDLNQSVPSLSPVCPKSVPSLSQVCPKSVLNLSQVCPKIEKVHTENAEIILGLLYKTDNMTLFSLMENVNEKNRSRFKQNILNPLIEADLIEPTIKDKPNSSKQAYRLTEKAKELINS